MSLSLCLLAIVLLPVETETMDGCGGWRDRHNSTQRSVADLLCMKLMTDGAEAAYQKIYSGGLSMISKLSGCMYSAK